jgi:hypothetical protein
VPVTQTHDKSLMIMQLMADYFRIFVVYLGEDEVWREGSVAGRACARWRVTNDCHYLKHVHRQP